MDRNEYLGCADQLVQDARLGARLHCDHGTGRFVSGFACLRYSRLLDLAARLYRAAGFSMLAGRVEWLARQEHIPTAWIKFDRLNSDGPILSSDTTRSTT